MSGNASRTLAQSARDIEKHIELVQPRSVPVERAAERAALKDKIKVRAKQRGEMAKQSLAAKDKARTGGKRKERESRLVPAGESASGMGMGMAVDP
jgi:large subunit ribosomal protein L24e